MKLFNKSDTLNEVKKRISERTGFPIETMIGFGTYGGQHYGKDGRLWTTVKTYNCDDNLTIKQTVYDSSTITKRYVYIYIDISKKEIFVKMNENQKTNDKIVNSLSKKINSLEINNENIQNKYYQLNNDFNNNKRQFEILKTENNELKKKQEENEKKYVELNNDFNNNKREFEVLKTENNKLKKKQEENEKKKEEINKKNIEAEKTIKEDIQEIDQKKIKELEEKIKKFVIKTFIHELDKQVDLKKWITEYMKKFTKEFMSYCENFNNSFKENSQKIIKEYNTNNNISIEHINYIIIGPAGVGKSTFINSSLLLEEDEKAEEGDGESITQNSKLYESKKLKMVRMWDTQGLDDKVSKNKILNEVQRLVEIGNKKGPDHYINIILYCTTGKRFQKEDGRLIQRIMKLYNSDNLPVIITQLQIYDDDDAEKMKTLIPKILSKYLNKQIVDKIEIKNVISKDKKMNENVIKAKGIPDLFKTSFDLMGRAITSATFTNFSEDIENLCKNYVEKRIDFLKQKLQYEMEIYQDAIQTPISDDNFNEIIKEKNQTSVKTLNRSLSSDNIYNNLKDKNYFTDNFYTIIFSKFESIYNNLNDVSLNYNNEDKPTIILFIESKLTNIQNNLIQFSNKVFEKFFKNELNEYFSDLQKKQNQRNRQFGTYRQIIDENEKEKELRDKLYPYFNNELLKHFLCLILKLFQDNLENILIQNYKKELKENKKMTEIINKKAEESLKNVTQKLKEKLLIELNKFFPSSDNITNNVNHNTNENANLNINSLQNAHPPEPTNENVIRYDDFNFSEY